MRISHLIIENFRSIKKLDIDLPQVCGLIGPNNAGKSNILLAIQRVLGRDWVSVSSFDEEDVYCHNEQLDINIKISLDRPLYYSKFKEADPTEVLALSFEYTRYKIGEQKGIRRLEQKCFDAKGKIPKILSKAPKKGEQYQYQPLVNIPPEIKESIPLIYIGTNRSLKEQLPGARYSLLRQLFEDINRDLHSSENVIKIKEPDGTEIESTRINRFQKLIDEAMKMLRTESFEALETSIKRNALRQLGFNPDTDTDKLDFFFTPFSTMEFYKALDLRVREGNFSISATEIGEGVQNALVISILQAFEERRKKGAILLIEEPEMFLHPQMQRSLYKTIREIGKTNQVIYTTHSPHFVSVPDYNEILLIRKNINDTIVCKSNLPSDEKRREKLIKELDPERNELFFASRLLLVEGDTEKLSLPAYAKRLNLDIDREGATIVEVGGKRNLMEFAQIAISFGIPAGILYDEDSSDFKDNSNEEKEFNNSLNSLQKTDGSVMVWFFSKKYEDHLRKTIGEDTYQKLCQKYPKISKAVRARLIAIEETLAIPEPLEEVLYWLAAKPYTKRK